jgi:hypothetical protein
LFLKRQIFVHSADQLKRKTKVKKKDIEQQKQKKTKKKAARKETAARFFFAPATFLKKRESYPWQPVIQNRWAIISTTILWVLLSGACRQHVMRYVVIRPDFCMFRRHG